MGEPLDGDLPLRKCGREPKGGGNGDIGRGRKRGATKNIIDRNKQLIDRETSHTHH